MLKFNKIETTDETSQIKDIPYHPKINLTNSKCIRFKYYLYLLGIQNSFHTLTIFPLSWFHKLHKHFRNIIHSEVKYTMSY